MPPTRSTGTYRPILFAGDPAQAFIPHPLPPADPPLHLDAALQSLHTEALASLQRLAIAAHLVPSPRWFIHGFVRKEAVITSQIEGTQATLEDVVSFEATRRSGNRDDVEEVCNYIAALEHARRALRAPKGLPLSTRLLCECHAKLMRGVRGAEKRPGALRTRQNWIGGDRPSAATFVPPPADEVPRALAALDRWLHAESDLPPLVRAGLAHAQFETIHPFLDGNGRIGRLLIALLVEHWKLIDSPLLYVSHAFRRRQAEYYARLSAVRTDGDWEGWTAFFLDCVRAAADDGVATARQLFARIDSDRRTLLAADAATVTAMRLLDLLPEYPVVTLPLATKLLKTSVPTAGKAIGVLVELKILEETSGKERDRVYAYRGYVGVMGEG